MIKRMRPFVLAAIASSVLVGAAGGQQIDSAYTKHDFEKCALVSDQDPVTVRRCPGYAGIPVLWTNEPDSSTIGFGSEGALEDSYDERFAFAVVQSTIEWRGSRRGGGIEPFATIVRFQLCQAIGGPCRPELVLFRLEGKSRSCIAASVSAARADANARARTLADSFVRNFRCGADQPRPPE
jgi:hypothetical protein